MKTELIIYDLDEMTELVSAAKSYDESPRVNCTITQDLTIVDELIVKNKSAVLIFSIKTKDKFQSLINLFKKNIPDIKSGRIKIAYFQLKKNQKVENILRKFNCNDFLDSELSKKSLCYKIDIWDKSVVSNIKKEELADVGLNSIPSSKKVLKDNTKRAHKTTMIDSMVDDFDIWISPLNNSKNILSKWLVNFKGPSPHISSWISVESDLWKFDIDKNVKSQFYQSEGSWYFKGLKPEFNWKEKVWSFSSNEFNLYFVNSEGSLFSRAFSEGSDLSLRGNSKYANLLSDLISKSADSKVSLELSRETAQDSNKVSLKGSQAKKEFMEADSKTEKFNSKMKGESKAAEPIKGHFKGKFKESTLKESSNYSLSMKPKKEKNLSGNLKNEKNKKDISKKTSNSKLEDNKSSNSHKENKPLAAKDNLTKKNKAKDPSPTAKLASIKDRPKNQKESKLSKDEGLVDRPMSQMEKAMINPAANAVRISSDSIFYLCDLVDLFEEELYVTIKDQSLDKSLKYNIVLSIDIGAQKATITTEGEIDSIVDGIYKFNISKLPKGDYEKFMSHLEIKQDEINDFIVAARGF